MFSRRRVRIRDLETGLFDPFDLGTRYLTCLSLVACLPSLPDDTGDEEPHGVATMEVVDGRQASVDDIVTL